MTSKSFGPLARKDLQETKLIFIFHVAKALDGLLSLGIFEASWCGQGCVISYGQNIKDKPSLIHHVLMNFSRNVT